jgi:DNA-directed RNA polymerase I, II, and III subunit RPABC3
MSSQNLLLDDIFSVSVIDPDGKKFDRVSRIKANGENYGMDLVLDVNVELYPLKVGTKMNLALAKTINLDGVTPSDETGYRPNSGPTLADKYEYVMYGKVFKFENTSSNKLYASLHGFTFNCIIVLCTFPLVDC